MPTVAFQPRELSTSKQAQAHQTCYHTSTPPAHTQQHNRIARATATNSCTPQLTRQFRYMQTYSLQESRVWLPTRPHETQTCGPATCKEAAGGCSHTPARPSTYGPTACNEATGGCPHREAQYMQTNNLQGTLKRDIRTSNLQ